MSRMQCNSSRRQAIEIRPFETNGPITIRGSGINYLSATRVYGWPLMADSPWMSGSSTPHHGWFNTSRSALLVRSWRSALINGGGHFVNKLRQFYALDLNFLITLKSSRWATVNVNEPLGRCWKTARLTVGADSVRRARPLLRRSSIALARLFYSTVIAEQFSAILAGWLNPRWRNSTPLVAR